MDEGTRKQIKTRLFTWRTNCRRKMVVLDSMLALRNQDFEGMFEELIDKFRKPKENILKLQRLL